VNGHRLSHPRANSADQGDPSEGLEPPVHGLHRGTELADRLLRHASAPAKWHDHGAIRRLGLARAGGEPWRSGWSDPACGLSAGNGYPVFRLPDAGGGTTGRRRHHGGGDTGIPVPRFRGNRCERCQSSDDQ